MTRNPPHRYRSGCRPWPDRGISWPLQPKPVDRNRGGDRADAAQTDAGPLETTFLQYAARGWVADARTRGEDLVTEVAECVIDQATRSLRRIAKAPERPADPIAQLRLLPAVPYPFPACRGGRVAGSDRIGRRPIEAAGADDFSADRDRIGGRL